MSVIDQTTTAPPEAVRRLAHDPRAEAQAALSDLMASLAPNPAADTWVSLGDVANRVVGKLARRTGRKIP